MHSGNKIAVPGCNPLQYGMNLISTRRLVYSTQYLCTIPEVWCTLAVHNTCVLYTTLVYCTQSDVLLCTESCTVCTTLCTQYTKTAVHKQYTQYTVCTQYCVQYTSFVYCTQYFLIVYCCVQYTITPHFPDADGSTAAFQRWLCLRHVGGEL